MDILRNLTDLESIAEENREDNSCETPIPDVADIVYISAQEIATGNVIQSSFSQYLDSSSCPRCPPNTMIDIEEMRNIISQRKISKRKELFSNIDIDFKSLH